MRNYDEPPAGGIPPEGGTTNGVGRSERVFVVPAFPRSAVARSAKVEAGMLWWSRQHGIGRLKAELRTGRVFAKENHVRRAMKNS